MEYPVNLKPVDKRLLKFLQKTGQEIKCPVYLVGGSVRDILLGQKNWDLDIVAVGNTELLVKKIQKNFKVKIIAYPRFRTFVINRNNGEHWFDLATARREKYEKPGALPEVFPVKNILEDLPRRDFTINALALSLDVLKKNNWKYFRQTEVIDSFGGLKDLQEKILRIIKLDSFTEDPTRIFRGARFVFRFNLRLSPETQKALLRARKNLALISVARRYQEIRYILLEKNPRKVFAILKNWQVLKYLVKERPELLKLFLNYPDRDFRDNDYSSRLRIFQQIDKKLFEDFLHFFQVPRKIRQQL